MKRKKKSRPKMGRPPVPRGEKVIRLSIGLRRDAIAALRRLARVRGVSVSALVQGAVRELLGKE